MNYATERLLAAARVTLAALENEQQHIREPHRETIDELQDAIFYFDAHGDKPQLAGRGPVRVLVALEGGCVQGAVADCEGVTVIVLDYDDEGADADRIFAIPQRGSGFSPAYVGHHDAPQDVAFIDAALAADLDDPVEAIESLKWQAGAWNGDNVSDATREMGKEAAAAAAVIEAKLPALLEAKAAREATADAELARIRQNFAARVAATA